MCIVATPKNCILPPYMLEEIMIHGTPAQQELARNNLLVSQEVREQRQLITQLQIQPPETAVDGVQLVYSAQSSTSLPGVPVRGDGDPPTGDAAVDEAFDGAQATYEMFRDVYGRNSIDGRGMRIDSTVHYGISYDNAFWNGRQMVYGDGDEDLPEDERLFNRFTIAIDIIGHELAHGITQFSAGLVYNGQSGALNESMSDVFGTLVKQYVLQQTASEADWIIGAGLFTPNVNGVGIRSMQAPGTAYDDPVLGKDPQPAHMRDYVQTSSDNGGVHINSGIPNRAFYVTAVEMGGFAWEKAGQIWYVTLVDRLRSNALFLDAARETFAVAGDLYGQGSLEQQAVRRGWNEVGIVIDEGDDGGGGETPPPSGCLTSLLLLGAARMRRLFS